MKNNALLLVFKVVGFVCCLQLSHNPVVAQGQGYDVKIKNGAPLKARKLEFQGGNAVIVKTPNGEPKTVPLTDVKRISPEKEGWAVNQPSTVRYRAIFETGAGVAQSHKLNGTEYSYEPDPDIKLYSIHGLQFKSLLFAGIGAGFNWEGGVEAASMPVFGELRLYPLNRKVSPILSSSAGYTFGINDSFSGFFFSPGLGAKIRLNKRLDLNLIAAYRSLGGTHKFRKFVYEPPYYYVEEELDVKKRHIDFRIGFVF